MTTTPVIMDINILALHDGGTIDPDDVVALAALIQRKIPAYIMACGAGDNDKTLEFLKEVNGGGYIRVAPEKTVMRMKTLLLIGPEADMMLSLLDLSRCEHIVFQGNTTLLDKAKVKYRCKAQCTAPSVNERGNRGIFKVVAAEQAKRTVLVDVVTTRECYEPQNMFGSLAMATDGALGFLTQMQREIVWASMLKNLAGRMHPQLRYNAHAESLINGVEPKGANYNSVLRVHNCVEPERVAAQRIARGCAKYISDLKTSLASKGMSLRDERGLAVKLLATSQRVADILGVEPVDKEGNLLTSTTIEGKPNDIAGEYPVALAAFKRVPLVVPAYDFAAQRYVR